MKQALITSLAILFILASPAQEISFSTHVIDNNFNGPAGIFVADIDNDNLKDVLAAGADGNDVTWWKNTGGNPIEWLRQDIDLNFTGAIYVHPGDVDGDGLMDVLAAGWYGNELAWWRNDGGDPITWTKYVISLNYKEAHEIMSCDVDKDGDMDVLGVSAGLNRISLFENDGNWPVNWTEHIIDNNFSGARSVDAKDIDGDGDIDIAGAALLDNEIAWWRNDGGDPIQFTKSIIGTGFTYAHKVQIVDIDKDGDQDILGTAYSKGLSWWENDSSDSVGWTKRFISYFNSAVVGWAFDADLDDDMDVVCSAQTNNGAVGLWSNDGELPINWDYDIVENDLAESWPMHYGDLDNDGDIDLVCGGTAADEIRWYENDLITDLSYPEADEGRSSIMSCYPIPFGDEVSISVKVDRNQLVKLNIYSLTGQLVKIITHNTLPKGEHLFRWDGTGNLNNFIDHHVFFIQLETEESRETLKLIKGW